MTSGVAWRDIVDKMRRGAKSQCPHDTGRSGQQQPRLRKVIVFIALLAPDGFWLVPC